MSKETGWEGSIEAFKEERDKTRCVLWEEHSACRVENGWGRGQLGQKTCHGSASSGEGPACSGRGQGPQDHAEEARGCGSHGLYLAGSWSCRTPGTSTCSSRSGGRIWAAATSPALPVPRPMANLSSCTASLGSSASWPSASSSPAWWPPWSCGGTATGATRRPPKRSVPRVLLLLSAAQRRESPTGWGFLRLVLTGATCVETTVWTVWRWGDGVI